MLSCAKRWTVRTLAAGMLAAAPLALAQEAGEQPAADPGFSGGPVLVIDHAELSKFFPDPRDQGLLKAFQMLPARVRELPAEINEEEFTAEHAAVISSILQALSRPGRIAVMYDETPTGGLFGYGVALSVLTKDKAEAENLEAKVRGLIAEANDQLRFKDSTRFEGMQELQLPFGVLSIGPREASDGWRYEIILGTMKAPDAAAEPLPEPEKGFTPLVRAYFNARGLAPALDMVESMMGQRGQDLPPQAQAVGEMIEEGLKTTYEAGFTSDAMVSKMVIGDARSSADRLWVGTEALSDAELRIFPADAGIAYMRRMSDGWASTLLETVAGQAPPIEEGFEQFKEQTGVDPREFVGSLGDTVGFFTSKTTGGGGLGSAVALVSVDDRAKLADSLGKLASATNAAADAQANGYVRIATHEDGGTTFYSLRFPGLPVPFEFTMALTDRWFVLAPIPQGAVAAVRHISGKGEGLVGGNRLGQLPNRDSLVEFSFQDTSEGLESGYTLLSMFGSAVANLVRSPSDGSRDPGMVIPLYGDLAKGLIPSVKVTFWRGDDLVTQSRSSKSTVANMGATFGTVSKILPFVAAGAAAGFVAGENHEFGQAEPANLPLRVLTALSLTTPDRLVLRALLSADREQSAEAAMIGAILHGPALETAR